ncbi:unnamed protein product [Rotaria socialis]
MELAANREWCGHPFSIHSQSLLTATCNAILEVFIVSVAVDPIVFYSTTLKSQGLGQYTGSTQGGTLLWIFGTGFARNGFSVLPSIVTTNIVQLVNNYTVYDCVLQTEKCTATQLACYTVAMPAGSYIVQIYVNGILIPASQYRNPSYTIFVSSVRNTPIIRGISPASGLPQRLVTVSGDFKSSCYSRDVNGCSRDSDTLIVRIYIGGQLCNLINSIDDNPYSRVNNTQLQCRFESNEVGIFNVTMIVNNQYGRSSTAVNLYQMSATGQLYNFRSHALISNVSPDSGSTQGGTILTISGQYFSNSSRYPVDVNVGGEPCTILSSNLTTIRCQISMEPMDNRTYYHGGRGLHIYNENRFIDLSTLGNATPPMPSVNATKTWTEEASIANQFSSTSTVWLIGLLRPPITATFTFRLQTYSNAILYLSADENLDNAIQIANSISSNLESVPQILYNNTNYFMLCISSTYRNYVQLSISASMLEVASTAGDTVSSSNTIQQIQIGNSTVSEHQQIVYTTNSINSGISEVQTIPVITQSFQIGFEGVYTAMIEGASYASTVEDALNDLPNIYPLAVSVQLVHITYEVTFPIEMGDVSLLTIISTAFNSPQNATETVQGLASNTKLAFRLDGATTKYFDFSNDVITNTMLTNAFDQLFTIRCPPSLNNRQAISSIVYVNEFETGTVYNDSNSITDMAFCGRNALTAGYLVIWNGQYADYMCFAYKVPPNSGGFSMIFYVQSDGDSSTNTYEYIRIQFIQDGYWHYTCINILDTFQQHSPTYLSVSMILIMSVYVDTSISPGRMFDTVTLRNSMPNGYEDETVANTTDQSSTNQCTFPFVYNNRAYTRCTIDESNMPICGLTSNTTSYCQNSSIGGVRRLYPKYQLIYNSLSVTHSSPSHTIDILFRYTACASPTLIEPLPSTIANVTSITNASKAIGGVYDIMFNQRIYKSIPAKITGADLTNLLQSLPGFGYVVVVAVGECAAYSYNIRWLVNAKQPPITIVNASEVTPVGTPLTVSTVQNGSSIFYKLPVDMLRTWHTIPQVEVVVGGYSSYCSKPNNDCPFQWSIQQTPIIYAVEQNETTIMIDGIEFGSTVESNLVSIGDSGSCNVTEVNETSIICTIINAPSGSQIVQVYVINKGFASTNETFTVVVPLTIISFHPVRGAAGGGYPLTIIGSGFSSTASVTIDGSPCKNSVIVNFSSITCIVPPITNVNNGQAVVTVIDGMYAANASAYFVYNIFMTPTILSISPAFVTMNGGLLNITGVGFGNSSVSVYVGSRIVSVLSSSSNQILVNLNSLSPGLYPVTVNTPTGFARPLVYIEYRFHVQNISPQVGSLYGGTDISVEGEGFDNSTVVRFRDQDNRILPCSIVSMQSTYINCQTTSLVSQVTITANGVDFVWSPSRQTVQQGTMVTWQWNSSTRPSRLTYKVLQVENVYSSQPVADGFDSGSATASGSFSYQFHTIGTYYYLSPDVDYRGGTSIRGIIDVVSYTNKLLTVEVMWKNFTAQICVFPFTFHSVSYNVCTSVNDTRPWCSPTSEYMGQRLYCTSASNTSCSSYILNTTSCGQSTADVRHPTSFIARLCTVESIVSLSPVEGTAGTFLTIKGLNFSGQMNEYDIQIGPSYHCPIINISSTTLLCQITVNSTLNAAINQSVRVARACQGYLGSNGLLQFNFKASISNISPSMGSIYGGTQVTINGDGFNPKYTRMFIANVDYTNMTTVSYSQIIFITPSQSTYQNYNLTVFVLVGINEATCLTPPCQYSWATSVTPYLNSVIPSVTQNLTTFTLSGGNFFGGTGTILGTRVNIDNIACNITAMTNESITCFTTDVEVGRHNFVVSIEGVGNTNTYTSVISQLHISSISPTTSGVYGGIILNIAGYGFSSDIERIQVTIGSNLCPVIQTTNTEIQCIIPAQRTSTNPAGVYVVSNGISAAAPSLISYNDTTTPHVTSVDPTSGSTSQVLNITGENFINGQTTVRVGNSPCIISNLSVTLITCTRAVGTATGYYPVIVNVNTIGDSNADVLFFSEISITNATPTESSYGGGLLVTVFGDGFNDTNVNISICNQICTSLVILSNNELTCITPSITPVVTNTSCNLTVTIHNVSSSIPFVYSSDLTATLISVSPTRAGTGGGTILTINGNNFPNSTDALLVTIAGVICSVQTSNSTCITCQTGSYAQSSIIAPVMVFINDSGYGIGLVSFQYIDLWSSPWTWGGNDPPDTGSLASIDSGVTIYFDTITPTLKVLLIDNATLIFDDAQDVALNTEYIVIVNGGCLQIGTEQNPFEHQAVITMYGQLRSIELPIFGAKVLALRGGTVDMHGKTSVRTWTKLRATANNGSVTITLLEQVDWPIGSQIIIATTGDSFSQQESEVRQITNISYDGLTLTLNEPLAYTHLGISLDLNSTLLDIRGEVGLLSHNIIFQGSTSSTWTETISACPDGFNPDPFAVQTCYLGRYGEEIGSDQFGATIMASQDLSISNDSQLVILRLSNVEIFNVGQAFRLSRYPINFHINGNMSMSYIKSSSVYLSFNRAINIEASNYITIESNVLYNIMGEAMSLEDGVEIGNVFRNNLVVFVRSSSSLLNEEMTPAAFWLTNPNNTVEYNAVAGSTHYGYWYRLLNTADGASLTQYPSYEPYKQPFGHFYNNSVHSSGRFGVWIYPQYSPNNPAFFDGLISWKNNKGFEWVMSSRIQIRNALTFDNLDTGISCVTAINYQEISIPGYNNRISCGVDYDSSVTNSVIIGDSGISFNPIIPSTAGLVVMWDRGLHVNNVVFINFPSNQIPAIYGPTIIGQCTDRCGGWMTEFSNISFINVTLRGKFRWTYDGIYLDDDGSLGGQPNSIITAPDSIMNSSSSCTPVPNFENAIQCSSSMGSWLQFSLTTNPYSWQYSNNGPLIVSSVETNLSTTLPWLAQQLTHPKGYTMTLQSNQTYYISFSSLASWNSIIYWGTLYDVPPGDYIIIQHNVTGIPSAAVGQQSLAPLSGSNSSNGNWYYDSNNTMFFYILKNVGTTRCDLDIWFQLSICACPNCICQPVTTPPQPVNEPNTTQTNNAL